MKRLHEIRDPIHVFVRLDADERRVLDSRPFQRLRYVHQLALGYLLYPGATHRRFEHSLGVAELAGRVFDVITHQYAVHRAIPDLLPEMTRSEMLPYWRNVLRMAALCHDLGHLPFSHAAETELLPDGCSHEDLTVGFIRSEEMARIWRSLPWPLQVEHIVKIAVGPNKLKDVEFSRWETILSEIIVGNAFGVDRMDYLLRDSYHAGVSYGRFDHYRLIDTLRILPSSEENPEPVLGVEEGGLHSAEALLLTRYFMFTQVYLHPVRRIYDIHLKDFLKAWLPNGVLPTNAEALLQWTDVEVTNGIFNAVRDPGGPGHEPACRIAERKHFKVVYSRNPDDIRRHPEPGKVICGALERKFGRVNVCRDAWTEKGAVIDFPVLDRDGRVASALDVSDTLKHIPIAAVDFVFVEPSMRDAARKWLDERRGKILAIARVEED